MDKWIFSLKLRNSAGVPLAAEALRAQVPPGVLCDVVSADEASTLALLLGPPAVLDALLAGWSGGEAPEEQEATVFVV